MKIVKTKEIKAKDVSEFADNVLQRFLDRTILHANSEIPAFFVYIQDYAWNAFLNHSINVYKEIRHEAQGIFTGHYLKDQYGEFIVATNYEEGYGVSQSAYVEMSEECLAMISEKCQIDGTLMLIWAHTHPGFGVFYSGTDYNCLRTNFYKPYQIGIVADIIRKQSKGYKVNNGNVDEFVDYILFNYESSLLSSPYGVCPIEDERKSGWGIRIVRLFRGTK
ncbi:MAG: hypothetical protein LBN06_04430 [Prevotellaceae bacterium]|jgi:proteasome lid subunit RPN8/RPN11|nr:hypothetical protein [Prevotellaceae bacterium]